MSIEAGLLRALHEGPGDTTTWLVLADWLEEQGDPRGELLRLSLDQRRSDRGKDAPAGQKRLLHLLEAGVRPCLPAIGNSLGMVFVLIPPGTFWMGSPSRESGRYPDESPLHEVEITRPFYLGIHSVTQEQYERVVGRNPSGFVVGGSSESRVTGLDTRHFPVESITWNDAAAFCRMLSAVPAEKRAKRAYRLPTEAEWEYACRAGSSRPYHFRSRLGQHHANFNGPRSLGRPCPVGSYPPNAFGLYDMCGNIWNWCNDWFDTDYYRVSPRQAPPGPEPTGRHVFRGGSWYSVRRNCRAACRSADSDGFADLYVGMRAVLEWRPELRLSS